MHTPAEKSEIYTGTRTHVSVDYTQLTDIRRISVYNSSHHLVVLTLNRLLLFDFQERAARPPCAGRRPHPAGPLHLPPQAAGLAAAPSAGPLPLPPAHETWPSPRARLPMRPSLLQQLLLSAQSGFSGAAPWTWGWWWS